MGSWVRIASTIWLPTRMIGLSEVIGSWKIIAISPPRRRRISLSESARRSSPRKQRAAGGDARRRPGQEAHEGEGGQRLAGAALAGDRQDLSLGDVEGHPVDDGAHTLLAADLDREVLHGEKRCSAHPKMARGM